MQLITLINKLNYSNVQTDIKNEAITDIESIRYLMSDSSSFQQDTLYIADTSTFSNEQIKNAPVNVLLVSSESSTDPISTDSNQNIVYIYNQDITTVFNELLDILLDVQKLANATSKLLEALSSSQGLQHIVDVCSSLIGNPLFIRDNNYKIVSYTKDVYIDDPVWNELTTKGFQSYDGFQFHKKKGFIELSSKVNIPIYHKIVADNSEIMHKGITEVEVYPNMKYLLYPLSEKVYLIRYSRVWCNIMIEQKVFGQMVVLDAFKNFSDYDIALIQKISNALSIELQKNKSCNNSISQKKDLFITNLLDGKIKDIESLGERLKIINLNFKTYLRLIIFDTNQQDESGLNFIKSFIYNEFGDVACTFYNGNFVAIYSSHLDNPLSELQIDRLIKYSKDSEMLCGISRSFISLLDNQKHYKQTLEGIVAGKRLDDKKVLFFYEDYVLQHIFNICSTHDSLQSFCHPALLTLINYDETNNTSFSKTLYSYVMKFKNPSELANELNVHRNTLYYRLTKIEEIMKLNLNNIDTLFRIYLSFKIIEYIDKKPEK